MKHIRCIGRYFLGKTFFQVNGCCWNCHLAEAWLFPDHSAVNLAFSLPVYDWRKFTTDTPTPLGLFACLDNGGVDLLQSQNGNAN